ncbi:MAG TPA: DNA polymerase III subunit [Bacteroidota bacterium]|nr:DNA polymerase III subunit [Bacteroidota bacterium]
MAWNEIVGQERAKDILRKSLERNRLAQAYLFSGPEGSGTEALSIELAKSLNCAARKPGTADACNRCDECRRFETLQHPNLHLIFALPAGKNETAGDRPMDKLTREQIEFIQQAIAEKARNRYFVISVPKASEIRVNSIRDIRRIASLSAGTGGKKVFVILEADRLNDESSNTLLKTLEEPLGDTVLILTTADPDALLPTIISRCQQIRLSRLSEGQIASALVSNHNVDAGKAEAIAVLVNGNYSLAIELLGVDITAYRLQAVDFLRTVLYKSRREVYDAIRALVEANDRKDLEQLLNLLNTWFRDAMLLSRGIDRRLPVEEEAVIRKFNAAHSNVDFGEIQTVIDEAISHLAKNAYIPLLLAVLAMRLRKLMLPTRQTVPIRPTILIDSEHH